jgi:hypothetical protein
MVTAAATSTAPTAIRMICQPGTPVAAAREVVAGTGPKRPSSYPLSGCGTSFAKAAGLAAAEASRPTATAARAT